jgi:hypothetical protein
MTEQDKDNVVPLAARPKKEETEETPTDEDLAIIAARNAEKKEREAKRRAADNKAVLRSYRIKN